MTNGARPQPIWGLGLDEKIAETIATALGQGFELRNWSVAQLPQRRDAIRQRPPVVWISLSAWNAMSPAGRNRMQRYASQQRVLILDVPGVSCDVEEILDDGFLTALSLPLTEKKIRDAMFRSQEVKSLYDDIYRMTQEIMLERELLARKTDQLLFLNRILARASTSLDPATVLRYAGEDLSLLFPLRSVQAILWQCGEDGGLEAEIVLPHDVEAAREDEWIGFFLDAAKRHTSLAVSAYTVNATRQCAPGEIREAPSPDPQRVMQLPLRAAGKTFGVLAIASGKQASLGKDKSQALSAAVNHLSLALHNAMLYREARTKADRDGLTRIHNRRAFDERIDEETRRHQRYKHPMSLLMLDVDRFKSINDTYGHQAGDAALREIGRILRETLRSTDFAARYGGEEFVVILPYTVDEHAWLLAERLRRAVEGKTFETEASAFSMTVSVGAATLRPGKLMKPEEFVALADAALYKAKAQGRNRVCAAEAGDRAKRRKAV